MKANFLPLDIVSETDVNSLVTFFEELREAIQACGIGWLDFTKFDPPIPSRETSPDILEMFRVEFSSKPYPTPDQINIFGFLDNGRADGLYLNEEIDNILYRDRLILRKGSPSFLGKPADYMRWADACAITLSYFETYDRARRDGWQPDKREKEFRKAWEVFALPADVEYHRQLSAGRTQ